MNCRLGLARADSISKVMLICLLTASCKEIVLVDEKEKCSPGHTMNTSNSSIARKGHSMASQSARRRATVENERSPPERLFVFLISCV